MEVGKREIIYLSLHCHHQNDFSVKMGSDESHHLKQSEAQSARAESTHKGVHQHSKSVTQAQQQRPESPSVTLTWHACKYKVIQGT